MRHILLASVLLIIPCCNKDVKQNNGNFSKDLSAEWIASADLNDGKYKLLYVIKFTNDNNFSWKITSYEGADSSFSFLY